MRFFSSLSDWAKVALELLPDALQKVWPLSTRHRRCLPDDIRRLSALLTTGRHELASGFSYWSDSGFTSAYLYYFLPWNLVRLSGVLPELPLSAPENDDNDAPAIWWDAGSGPLTLPMALWLSKPQWHDSPIKVWASDNAERPLKLGRALFHEWGRIVDRPTWEMRIEKSRFTNLERGLSTIGNLEWKEKKHGPWLFSAANFLNEIVERGRRGRAEGRVHHNLANSIFPADSLDWCSGQMLFVEPGTRLGSRMIMQAREEALERGMPVLYPCTHQSACPLQRGDSGKTWCHFCAASNYAPEWLRTLSRKCGLDKKRLSLSILFLGRKVISNFHERVGLARIISDRIFLPDLKITARYACMKAGIILLEDRGEHAYGDIIRISLGNNNGLKDKKHGIPVIKKT